MICARSYSNSIVQSCSLIVWEQVRYHLLNLHATSSCLWIHKQLSYAARMVITVQTRERDQGRDRGREKLRPFEPTNQPAGQPSLSPVPSPSLGLGTFPILGPVPSPSPGQGVSLGSVRFPSSGGVVSRFGVCRRCQLWSSGRGCNRLYTNHVPSSMSSAPIGRRQCCCLDHPPSLLPVSLLL